MEDNNQLLHEIKDKVDSIDAALRGNEALGQIGLVQQIQNNTKTLKSQDEQIKKLEDGKKKIYWISTGLALGASFGKDKLLQILEKLF